MENASKALIIAGAILLSILIIALGIYVFNLAKGSMNTNQLTEMEVSTFNSPFTQYEGRQIGSNVKSLLDKVIANAGTNKEADDKLPNVVYEKGAGTLNAFNINSHAGSTDVNNLTALRKGLSNSHYYNVTMDADPETGLINLITIKY